MGEELGPEGRMDPEHLKDAAQRRDNAQKLGVPIGVPGSTLQNPEMDELPHDDEEAQRAYYEKEGTDESRVVEFRTFADVPETPHQPIATAVFLRGRSPAAFLLGPRFVIFYVDSCQAPATFVLCSPSERLRRRTMLKRWPGPRARLRAPPRCRRAA